MLRFRESSFCNWSRIPASFFYVVMVTFSLLTFVASSSLAGDKQSTLTSETQSDSPAQVPERLQSGPRAGTTIHQFFVRAVTGPHRNRSVCYVCRYGSRPVVMVLIQKPDPNIAALLKAIDAIVDKNRVSGLRSFGVLVTDESARAVPILQTMAFDERIRMPLTAATTAIAGPSCHRLHRNAATTVVLYRDQQAVKNYAFPKGSISEDSISQLINGVKQLIEPGQAD